MSISLTISVVWSGSPNANNSDNAWNVNFNNGNSNNNNRNNNNQVRLVRGGEWQEGVGGEGGHDPNWLNNSGSCPPELKRRVLVDYFSLYKAWQKCRRRKRATPQAQFYEAYLLDNLIETVQALRSNHWRPRRPVCFMVDKPKAREIHVAHYSDRVVHHWLVPGLEALYEPIFIHDVYSNRKDKGTHMAVKRLQYFMRGVSRTGCDASWLHSHAAHGDESALGGYFLQLDIKNFFNSVDRRILFSLLQKRLRKAVRQGKVDEATAVSYREICHIILKQDVGKEAFMAATPAELARIPAYKRLINAGQDKGLPIGNLTSQFFANVYLNELDQFVKHQLKCHHYLRYVDDSILLHRDPDQLRRWHREIEFFLMEKLGLELKQPVILQPIRQGANFLGYIVRPDYLLVRQRVVGNLWEKLISFEKQWIKGNDQQGWVLTLLLVPREHLRSVLASYWGHFSHADHYRLARKVFTRFPWLSCLFDLQDDRFVPLWQPKDISSYKSQQRYFQRQFPDAEIRMQRGCQYDKVLGNAGNSASGSHAPHPKSTSCGAHGHPSAPASQARGAGSSKHAGNSERFGNPCSPAGAGSYELPCNIDHSVGARPCGRTGLPQSTDQNYQINLRLAVSKVIVRQQGYLKGGLRRRCIESITFLPSSQTGVSLCASFAP